MLKTIGIKFAFIALITAGLAADSMAQTRISFARGRTSASVGGTVTPNAMRSYRINVREGQTMTVQVSSALRMGLDVDGPNGHIEFGDNGFAQIEIYQSGDHYIGVKNEGGRAARFTMTVTVR